MNPAHRSDPREGAAGEGSGAKRCSDQRQEARLSEPHEAAQDSPEDLDRAQLTRGDLEHELLDAGHGERGHLRLHHGVDVDALLEAFLERRRELLAVRGDALDRVSSEVRDALVGEESAHERELPQLLDLRTEPSLEGSVHEGLQLHRLQRIGEVLGADEVIPHHGADAAGELRLPTSDEPLDPEAEDATGFDGSEDHPDGEAVGRVADESAHEREHEPEGRGFHGTGKGKERRARVDTIPPVAAQTSSVPRREDLELRAAPPVAFVLGASGYVGASLVEALARDEHVARVIAHVRPESPRASALATRLERHAPRAEVDRTPLEAGALMEALEALAPTHLFLCHGTTARRARSEGIANPYEAVDVGLTVLLCEQAAALTRPPRVVLLSSMGTGPRARGAYLSARWRAEEIVRASGLPHTICRAPLLTGPDRAESRPGERWAARLLDPLLGFVGALGARRLAARYRSMDATEAAEGLVRTGFHYMTIGRVVLGDELRRRGVYETETPAPASRREGGRH